MFLLDDILLAPIKGLAAVCQKVHDAAQEDLADQEKAVLAAWPSCTSNWMAVGSPTPTSTPANASLLDRLEACQEARKTDRHGSPGDETSSAGDWLRAKNG